MPEGLMTTNPDSGSRPLTLPEVQATRLWRGSSAFKWQISLRSRLSNMLHLSFDLLKSFHHIVLTTSEIIVQAQVFSKELLVDFLVFGDGLEGLDFEMRHSLGGIVDGIVAASGLSRCHCAEHGGPEGRCLLGSGDFDLATSHIG